MTDEHTGTIPPPDTILSLNHPPVTPPSDAGSSSIPDPNDVQREPFYGTATADTPTERAADHHPIHEGSVTMHRATVERIRELTERIGGPDAGVGAQIRALLP